MRKKERKVEEGTYKSGNTNGKRKSDLSDSFNKSGYRGSAQKEKKRSKSQGE